MSPRACEKQILPKNDELTVTKEGGVSKIKTTVRTTLSSVKRTQALNVNNFNHFNRKYKLNRKTQVRKIVLKK